MPSIDTFLQTAYQFIKALFVRVTKRMYRTAAVLMTGAAVVTVIAFNSVSFGGVGKNAASAHREYPDDVELTEMLQSEETTETESLSEFTILASNEESQHLLGQRLEQGIQDELAKEALEVEVIAFAQGNVGKAIQLASSDDFNEMKASALQLIKRLDDIDLYEMTAAVKQIADYKLEINDYFDLMMIWYRDVLYFKATGDVNGLIFKDEVYDIKRQAEKSSYNGINSILEALRKAQIRLDANVNFDLVIELLLLTIKEN